MKNEPHQDEIAKFVVITPAMVKNGPPAPHRSWDAFAMLAFLRSKGIEADRFATWCRDKLTGGYRLYYYGNEASEKSLKKLWSN